VSDRYDVFISYSQPDRPWAKKLADDLSARRLRVFFDKERLDVGYAWDTQLKESLYASRNLVVVWTDANARQSDWVSRERAAFWMLPATHDRAQISLNLQGRPNADAAVQGIEDLLVANVDWQKIDSISPALWNSAIERIMRSLSRTSVAMPVVTLTLTRAELGQFNDRDWADIERDLGLSKQQVMAMYGDTRGEWRPLGGSETIDALLSKLENRINGHITGPSPQSYRWELAPEAFWTEVDVAESFAVTLASPGAPSLLIIDPIAIRNRDVLDRLYLFKDSVGLSHTTIVVLAPFVMPAANQMLRQWLMDNAVGYFRPMFRPAIPPRTLVEAQCALYSGDEDELLRLAWSAVGRGFARAQTTRPEYLQP
jgi:hypothetical protein